MLGRMSPVVLPSLTAKDHSPPTSLHSALGNICESHSPLSAKKSPYTSWQRECGSIRRHPPTRTGLTRVATNKSTEIRGILFKMPRNPRLNADVWACTFRCGLLNFKSVAIIADGSRLHGRGFLILIRSN